MRRQLHLLLVAAIIMTTVLLSLPPISANLPRCEAYGEVERVVDGDTLDITRLVYLDEELTSRIPSTKIRVRLADVNAPELSTPEGERSKLELAEFIEGLGRRVCLDIDSLRTFDPYGRVIAVVYLRINTTHFVNLNKWLLENGYAIEWNFTDNEFDPSKWELYVTFHFVNEELNTTISSEKQKGFLEVVWSYAEKFLVLIILTAILVLGVSLAAKGKPRR